MKRTIDVFTLLRLEGEATQSPEGRLPLAGSETADGFAGTFGFGISPRHWVSRCHRSGSRTSPSSRSRWIDGLACEIAVH